MLVKHIDHLSTKKPNRSRAVFESFLDANIPLLFFKYKSSEVKLKQGPNENRQSCLVGVPKDTYCIFFVDHNLLSLKYKSIYTNTNTNGLLFLLKLC